MRRESNFFHFRQREGRRDFDSAAKPLLTSLAGLVDLKRQRVLSANNAHFDIPCLARLTRLQSLGVVFNSEAGILCGDYPVNQSMC